MTTIPWNRGLRGRRACKAESLDELLQLPVERITASRWQMVKTHIERLQTELSAHRPPVIESQEGRIATTLRAIATHSDRLLAARPQTHNVIRGRRVKRSTPKWADKRAIEDVYEQARLLTLRSGVRYSVDHVIPLAGLNVCGLHVPENLAVIPAVDNSRKGNGTEG